MDEYERMMKPHRNLVGWECFVLDPVANIVERFIKTNLNLFSIDADVFI